VSYELTIEPLGVTIELEEQQTILDAALRAGIWLPHVCNHGLCSSCKVELIEGEVEHGEASPFALMDYEREEGLLLTCCATAESDLVIEADIVVDDDARFIPVEDFGAEVVQVSHPTSDLARILLKLDRRFDFQPGQSINLKVPGVDAPRAFSVAGLPDDELLELHVRQVPGGMATSYLCEKLIVGEQLSFSGPYGQFFARESRSEPALLLSAGSGLSGVLGIARRLLEVDPNREVFLYHGARNVEQLYADDTLRQLDAEYSAFHYRPVVSQSAPEEGWSGRTGHVPDAMGIDFDQHFSGHVAYICGSPAMVESTISSLIKGRLFERDIFVERFYNADNADSVKRSQMFKTI